MAIINLGGGGGERERTGTLFSRFVNDVKKSRKLEKRNVRFNELHIQALPKQGREQIFKSAGIRVGADANLEYYRQKVYTRV